MTDFIKLESNADFEDAYDIFRALVSVFGGAEKLKDRRIIIFVEND